MQAKRVARRAQSQTAQSIPDHSNAPMVMIDIKAVKPWACNPRINDEAAKHLAVLIQEHGFVNPIIIWSKNGVMYAGHTRIKAAKILGLSQVPARFINFESEEKAIAFGLSDNRANEWAEYDEPMLVLALGKLESVDVAEVVRMTGFEQEEIEGIKRGWDKAPPEEFQEVGEDIDTEHRCPKCGYEWSGKVR